jgi:Na+/proline symporter
VPVVLAALFWRRSTAWGAIAAVGTVAALWIYFFSVGFGRPGYSVGGTGVMPVAVLFAASSLVLVVVSLFTRPPALAVVDRYVPERGGRR